MDKEAGGCHMLIINVTNDGTGNDKIGHYDYEVLINTTVISKGKLEAHDRSQNWRDLIRKLMYDSYRSGDTGE
jgi:hypothetical protein